MKAIMYSKFNNNDKGMSLLYSEKGQVVVVNKPLKQIEKEPVIEQPIINNNEEQEEVVLLWQNKIHENYLKHRNGGRKNG
mgnify:CR=1 FL=1